MNAEFTALIGTTEVEGEMVSVICGELPGSGPLDREALLDGARDRLRQGGAGTVVEEKSFEMGATSGRDWTVLGEGDVPIRARALVRGRRFVSLTMAPLPAFTSSDQETFFGGVFFDERSEAVERRPTTEMPHLDRHVEAGGL